jgi:LysM repeat protein
MEERNQRPEEVSKLPIITLMVLVGFILAMLYVGYEYFSDSPEPTKVQISEKSIDNANTETESAVPEKEIKTKPEETAKAETETVKTKSEQAKPEEEKVEEKPKVEPKKLVAEIPTGGIIIPHTVQSGETFFGIANRYNLKADVLRALNPDVDPQALKVGVTRLKVKVKAKHTVGAGDILSVVAKKYDITKKALMDANKLSKDFSKRGDELIIPLK